MERGLFYNALPDDSYETGYDRNYDADDISSWLGAVVTTGVVKSTNGLKVLADSGMNIKVNAGKAIINGKPYENDNVLSFTVPTAPTGTTSRKDALILRLDNSINQRATKVHYVQGDSAGNLPKLQRTATIYELMLGYITVAPNATTIAQTNITDLRGDADTQITLLDGDVVNGYCPYTTFVKGYDDYYDAIIERFKDVVEVSSTSSVITTTLAKNLYNQATDIVNVYLNGALVDPNDYSLSTPSNFVVVTFNFNITAGQEVFVEILRAFDGEGLPNVLEDYLKLKQTVESLSSADEFNYVCNGVNDNVLISNLVKTFLSGDGYGSMKLKICGTFGYTAMATGDGSSTVPYVLFDIQTTTNRTITLDFTNCSQITVSPETGKTTVIFNGEVSNIIGLNLVANNTEADTVVQVFNKAVESDIKAENCRFWINAYKDSFVARIGTFTNCRASVTNMSGNSFCFNVAVNGLVTVKGGEFYAYTADSAGVSAVVGITSGANTVAILYGVNAPTLARGGYYQTNSISQTNGWVCCTDLISALPLSVVSGQSNIRGTIALSKGGYL